MSDSELTYNLKGEGMYETGNVLPAVSTAAGIATLPNTGDNVWLLGLALVCIAVGGLFLATSAARFIAKKFYSA